MTITVSSNTITLNSGRTLDIAYAQSEGINYVSNGSNADISGRVSFGGGNNSIDFIDWNDDQIQRYNVPGSLRQKTSPVTRPSNIYGQWISSANTVPLRNWCFSSIAAALGKETAATKSYTIGMGTDRYITSIAGSFDMTDFSTVPSIWSQTQYYTLISLHIGVSASLGSFTVNGSAITPTTIVPSTVMTSMSFAMCYARLSTTPLASANNISYSYTKASSNMWSGQYFHVIPGDWVLKENINIALPTSNPPVTQPFTTFSVQQYDLVFVSELTPNDAQVIYTDPTGPLKLLSGRGGRWYNGAYVATYIATADGVCSYRPDSTTINNDSLSYNPARIQTFRVAGNYL